MKFKALEYERETQALKSMTPQERAAHEEARDAQRFGAEREKDALQARCDAAHDAAINILTKGDARRFILDTFKTQHIGDIDTAEGILIGTANQSISNSKGIQSAVYGESGQGKSHAARAMLHLMPEAYYMIATLSDKSLFYMNADELRAGMTIFSDDAKISDGLEGIIKRSTSAFQEETVNKVSSKEGGKWQTKSLTIPARINWLLTSVDSQGSEQLLNRQIGFGVDESSAQDDNVTAFELTKALEGKPEFEITDDVLTCREIIQEIKTDSKGKERLSIVKIPYALRIEWLDRKNRRNLPIFLDMVKGYTALNFMQREHDIEGALIATESDFKAAERLYNTRGGFQSLHIHEREKEMLQYIVNNGEGLTTADLMSKMNLSASRIRQIADRLTTVLPKFNIEKRTETKRDGADDSRSVTTQVNYYCYDGRVTLDLFGSVVSLRPDAAPENKDYKGLRGNKNDKEDSSGVLDVTADERKQGGNIAEIGPDAGGVTSSGKSLRSAEIPNVGYNNNIINNNNNNRVTDTVSLREDTRARVYSCGGAAAAGEKVGVKDVEVSNSKIECVEALDENCVRSVSGVCPVLRPLDLAVFNKKLYGILKDADVIAGTDKDTLITIVSRTAHRVYSEYSDAEIYERAQLSFKEDKKLEALLIDKIRDRK